jgi:hypothetical protein
VGRRRYSLFQVFANRLFIAKIVMFLHQTVEQRLLRGAAHLLELERLKFVQRIFDGSLIDQHRFRPGSLGQRIMPHITDRRQRDLPSPLQHQQHAAAYHVAQRAIRLAPLPGFAYSDRQLATAFLRIMGLSLGGYYEPRAVAFESRFALGAVWGAYHDWARCRWPAAAFSAVLLRVGRRRRPVAREYMQSKEFADDIKNFNVSDIVDAETTILIPSTGSPLH